MRGWCAVYSRRWKWVTAATTVARMNRGWKCIRVHRSQVKRAYLAEYFLSLAPLPCIIFQRVQRRFLAQFSTNSFPLFFQAFSNTSFPSQHVLRSRLSTFSLDRLISIGNLAFGRGCWPDLFSRWIVSV